MKRYLFPQDYMADPSVHVFNGKIYIYPSHDYYSGIPEDDWGIHFDMKDYHVLSITGDPMTGEVKDEGVVLTREQIPWAKKQLWDCDVQEKDGKYYMYFPAKDKTGIFRCGVRSTMLSSRMMTEPTTCISVVSLVASSSVMVRTTRQSMTSVSHRAMSLASLHVS